MNPSPEEMSAEELKHLLENDLKAALDKYIPTQLRRQYVAALQELNRMMKDPEHNEKEVLSLSSRVSYPGKHTVEDIPQLIELERSTYIISSSAYKWIEIMVFKQLNDLIADDELIQNEPLLEQLLSFLKDTFHYIRKRDRFASQRRFFTMKITANIALRTKDDENLALLHEALTHSTPKIRAESIIHVLQAYNWLGYEIPASLIDRLKHMAETDRSKKVRQTAQGALHELEFYSDIWVSADSPQT